jgi:hypothetical protein
MQDELLAHALLRLVYSLWFTKEARKAKITDEAFCHAIRQVMQGKRMTSAVGCTKNV